MIERTWRSLLAASLLTCTAMAQAGTVQLDTGLSGWSVSFNTPTGTETAAAKTYDCSPGAPYCMSITSNGFADGDWINNAAPAGFSGEWTALISFHLPTGATQARLDYEFFGVDDYVEVYSDAVDNSGNWGLVAAATIFQVPTGSAALGAAGGRDYQLKMRVRNNGDDPYGPGLPLSAGDGTAVSAALRVVFEDGGTVPEPGTLALVGAGAWVLLRSRRRGPAAAA